MHMPPGNPHRSQKQRQLLLLLLAPAVATTACAEDTEHPAPHFLWPQRVGPPPTHDADAGDGQSQMHTR